MPRERRHYSAKTKAKTVGIAAVEGVTEAERQTGIPKETIHYWLNKPEFAPLRTTAREVVIDEFWVGIQVALKEVVSGLLGDAPLNHKADVLRTLTEKYALLNGEATDRTETRSLTEGFDDHETRAIVDAAREYVGRARSREGELVAPQTEVGAPTKAGADPPEG